MRIIFQLTVILLLLNIRVVGAKEEPGAVDSTLDAISITQTNWIYYAQEPLIDLRLARKAFENGDFESAAYALRQVNAYLTLESLRLDEGERRLNQIIKNIDDLAAQLEGGDPLSNEDYDKVLTEVNYTLSNHYYVQATKTWENDKPKRTGYALQASANYLERAEKISDYSFTDDNRKTIKESRELSKELINGSVESQNEEVKPKIKALGVLLKDFKVKSDEEFRVERRF
jgi:hypothetical protein